MMVSRISNLDYNGSLNWFLLFILLIFLTSLSFISPLSFSYFFELCHFHHTYITVQNDKRIFSFTDLQTQYDWSSSNIRKKDHMDTIPCIKTEFFCCDWDERAQEAHTETKKNNFVRDCYLDVFVKS